MIKSLKFSWILKLWLSLSIVYSYSGPFSNKFKFLFVISHKEISLSNNSGWADSIPSNITHLPFVNAFIKGESWFFKCFKKDNSLLNLVSICFTIFNSFSFNSFFINSNSFKILWKCIGFHPRGFSIKSSLLTIEYNLSLILHFFNIFWILIISSLSISLFGAICPVNKLIPESLFNSIISGSSPTSSQNSLIK